MKLGLVSTALVMGIVSFSTARADLIKYLMIDAECKEMGQIKNPRMIKIVSDTKGSQISFEGNTFQGETFTIGKGAFGGPFLQARTEDFPISMLEIFSDQNTEEGKIWSSAFMSEEKLANFSIKARVRYESTMSWVEEAGRYMNMPKEKPFEVICTGNFQSLLDK